MPGKFENPMSSASAKIEMARGWTSEDVEEQLAAFLAQHPEEPEIPAAARREFGPEAVAFEEAIHEFERRHDLAALNAITELKRSESEQHPLREPARKELDAIVAMLTRLQKETDVDEATYLALLNKLQPLWKAVGIINNDKVDHTRDKKPARF